MFMGGGGRQGPGMQFGGMGGGMGGGQPDFSQFFGG